MNWLRKLMIGRYGVDQLSMLLLIISIILSILSRFIDSGIIPVIFMVTAIIAYFRIFSKNISKRYQENNEFLKFWNPIKSKFNKRIKRLKNTKDYRHFKCPNCDQTLRVPRGKGKVAVTCPKCKTGIIKKT